MHEWCSRSLGTWGRLALREVARAGHAQFIGTAEFTGHERRFDGTPAREPQGRVPLHHVEAPVTDDQLDLDLGMLHQELGHEVTEERVAEQEWRADAQQPLGGAVDVGHGGVGFFDLRDHARGPFVVSGTGRCRANVACGALQEPNTEPFPLAVRRVH